MPRALVIGLARSGMACARALHREDWDVVVVDRKDGDALRARATSLPAGVEVRLGPYPVELAVGFDMVCPSPGVPWDAPELAVARAHGIPVRSEIDLVFRRCPAPILGITGTNGKTTTTTLAGAVIAAGGARVHVGGNIGEPMLDRLDQVRQDDWVVLELSSFQIESVEDPRCRLAAVLNVTPDHLDRHGTFEAYAAAKRRLVEHADPDGAVVLGADDVVARGMAQASTARVLLAGFETGTSDGATVRGDDVVVVERGQSRAVMPVADIPLFGAHNVQNVLVAVALGHAAGVGHDAIAGAVRGFHAVHHRLEPVLEAGGVLWVNDSKATNVDAAVKALRAFPDRPIVWIGGGETKGVGPEDLAREVSERARYAVLNGATGPEVDRALASLGYNSRTLVPGLVDAVRAAHDVARPGDVVLLAPGYTSFDQFADYEQRGETFAALVRDVCGAARGRS
ncbi:MAG TPA: UDP-N-acetylmuramoyl-L-alanine--D-glutamate ligase [Candidatus Angelobacter sp.]|jgi:UDP-N-acetylmuramoylalanine--D-glutamate ligase|nr:UDP-N-acetylmuramoyl-L-alanine--D-glutamate ligase [Candidatus Angelobacter sp.]